MESDRGNRDYPDWFLYQYATGEKDRKGKEIGTGCKDGIRESCKVVI